MISVSLSKHSFSKHRFLKHSRVKNQTGTVLLTVLLVVAFIAILIVEVNQTVTRQANLNRNLIYRDQAYAYLNGLEELAKIYLKTAFDAEKEDIVHLGQAWAKQDITFPIDGGAMTAKITDMQSCFNLNSLGIKDPNNQETDSIENSPQPSGEIQLVGGSVPVPPVASSEENKINSGELILTTLLEKILPDAEIQPSALAAAARDWIDTDLTPSGPDGVEDLYYQSLEMPYLAANGPIAHPSELRMVKFFVKGVYAKLRPYVCVLPDGEKNKINVNTITTEKSDLLYAALGGKVAQNKVKQLISNRPEKGYTMDEFWQEVGISVKSSLKQKLDVTSQYFQMEARAEINTTKVYMKTLFVKQDDNNFKVVSRYFGKE